MFSQVSVCTRGWGWGDSSQSHVTAGWPLTHSWIPTLHPAILTPLWTYPTSLLLVIPQSPRYSLPPLWDTHPPQDTHPPLDIDVPFLPLTLSGGHQNTYGWEAGGTHPTAECFLVKKMCLIIDVHCNNFCRPNNIHSQIIAEENR